MKAVASREAVGNGAVEEPLISKGVRQISRFAHEALASWSPRKAKRRQQSAAEKTVYRQLNGAAALLSFSVLADSALEHYRGGFYNPVMYVAPAVSAATLGTSVSAILDRSEGVLGSQHLPRKEAIFGTAVLTGLVGLGFHVYNVLKRTGGVDWENLFYGAPLAAPFGITFAGLAGLGAGRLLSPDLGRGNSRLGLLISVGAALGLIGTSTEAGLLHFRGAYHNQLMYLPVTLPPLASVALGASAAVPSPGLRRAARYLLGTTAGMGLLGTGLHAYGVGRNMGGWTNWSQNLQVGPPLPAPPSFTGMAVAGMAGLSLAGSGHD